jgi:Ca2+-binding EF-hand superfamily protein
MGVNASGNLGGGEFDMNRLQGAKVKVETYIRNNEVTLGILFSVLDTDSNKRIDMNEFKNKMRQLHTGLDEEEMNVLFRSMDRNSDRSIAYGELVEMFSEINTKQIIKKMQGIVTKSKLSAETFFNNECREDSTKQKMSLNDFNRLIKSLYERVSPAELVYVQRHFDRGNKGYVSKQEFLSILNQDVTMQNVGSGGFQLDIEDIIKPLATRCRNFNYNVAAVFDNYDRNKNGRLSAEELRDALQKDFSISLEQDEVKGITDFFVNKYKTKEISKTAFIDLLQNSHFKNKADA